MAWSVPATAVAGQALTASMWNTSLRDNLLETEVAKATGPNQTFSTTGLNSIAARTVATASIATSEATSSTTFVDLPTPGPSVTVTTGTNALVILTSTMAHNVAGSFANATYTVSGATTFTSSWSILNFRTAASGDQIRCSGIDFASSLNPGSNTFKMVYCHSSGGGGSATFLVRNIIVWPL